VTAALQKFKAIPESNLSAYWKKKKRLKPNLSLV
jgi:hypothetical protein